MPAEPKPTHGEVRSDDREHDHGNVARVQPLPLVWG
jgi:hypothetical protein